MFASNVKKIKIEANKHDLHSINPIPLDKLRIIELEAQVRSLETQLIL